MIHSLTDNAPIQSNSRDARYRTFTRNEEIVSYRHRPDNLFTLKHFFEADLSYIVINRF